ncbi:MULTISPECIES: hypothetical protein [Rothia]|uniref:hypothetical protein n=1 Tax=Rothia TaxID=32207 RepID=UPI001EF01996|nr:MULTISPECIES: hypothetical protein [Rothia]
MTATTAAMTTDNLDSLTALADLETAYGYGLDLEPVAPGEWFTKRHKTEPDNGQALRFNALMLHRDLLEAETAKESRPTAADTREFYDQYKTSPNDVPRYLLHHIDYDKITGGASVVLGVTKDMTLDTQGVKALLGYLYQVTDELEAQRSSERPRNIALHLLEAADRIEEYAVKTDSENWLDVAGHLFAQYLVIFSAREYQDDFTPIEYLEDALLSEDDYTALEKAGLIAPMVDAATGNLASYHLTLFAGEE